MQICTLLPNSPFCLIHFINLPPSFSTQCDQYRIGSGWRCTLPSYMILRHLVLPWQRISIFLYLRQTTQRMYPWYQDKGGIKPLCSTYYPQSCGLGMRLLLMHDGSSVGNFGGWGILECMRLLSNYNMRQVNTQLRYTALRQDLRLHYIFDFGCKSSNYVFKH